MARKARKSARRGRGRRRFPWLWVVAVLVLVTAIAVVARNGSSPLAPGRAERESQRESGPAAAGATARLADPAPHDPEDPRAITIDSDWDRIRLRTESELLRIFRGDDRAALNRLTSRTLRGSLEEIGIDRERIDERPGSAAVAGVGRAPVQWKIQVPPRASLFKINDAVTQAVLVLGGRVIRGVERPARTAGTALDLRIGYGERVTHAILVEPNPTLADAGTQMSFVVLDLEPSAKDLLRSYLGSEIPFSVAVRPDLPQASRAAREVRQAKREIFLHLPMEPRGYPKVDPGKNAILLDLSRVEIEERISRSLDTVGGARGIVTRMGSAAVNDPDVMRAVLGEVKRRDLLFVDAHGAGPSVVEETGEEIGARTLTLGGVLDGGGGSPSAVRARLKQLVQTARQRGALLVGVKAHGLALNILEAERGKLAREGVEIVPASRLAP